MRVFVIAFLCAVVCSSVALAKEAEQLRGPSTVALLLSRKVEVRSLTLARAVETQLADLPISFQIEWVDDYAASLNDQETVAEEVAGRLNAFAVIWCDLEETDRVYFYLTSSVTEKNILVRRVDGAGEESFDEAIAIIARSSIDALLAGGKIGIAKELEDAEVPEGEDISEESTSPEVPVFLNVEIGEVVIKLRSKERTNHLALDTAIAFQIFSYEHQVASGLALMARFRILHMLCGFVGYTFLPLSEYSRLGVQLSIEQRPIYAGVLLLNKHGRFEFGAGVALKLNFLKEDYRTVVDDMEAQPSRTRIGVAFVPSVRLNMHILESFGIFASLGAEIPLNRVMYTLNDGLRYQTIFEPWPVQPVVILGIVANLF